MHGAPLGRYNPSYERVWSKAPIIEIAGVKDRFGYDNKNSPLYIKPAEGQVSAAGEIDNFVRNRKGSHGADDGNHSVLQVAEASRNKANKTMVQFKHPKKISNLGAFSQSGDSVELVVEDRQN